MDEGQKNREGVTLIQIQTLPPRFRDGRDCAYLLTVSPEVNKVGAGIEGREALLVAELVNASVQEVELVVEVNGLGVRGENWSGKWTTYDSSSGKEEG